MSGPTHVWIRGRKRLLGVQLLLACSLQTAFAADRIFADSFEPCCTLGGEVSSLLGSGLVLHLAAGDISENKLISPSASPRSYAFLHTVPSGRSYAVDIVSQPAGQACTVSNADGVVGNDAIVNIDVNCNASLIWNLGNWDNGAWN